MGLKGRRWKASGLGWLLYLSVGARAERPSVASLAPGASLRVGSQAAIWTSGIPLAPGSPWTSRIALAVASRATLGAKDAMASRWRLAAVSLQEQHACTEYVCPSPSVIGEGRHSRT